MLALSGQVAYISEPLNVLHRPGVMRAQTQYWYTYICQDNEQEFLGSLQETLSFNYHYGREINSLHSSKDFLRMLRDGFTFSRGKFFNLRPLLKDPFAVFSTEWFAHRLNCKVVILIRHPARFVSSLVRNAWPFDFTDLLKQSLLMRDWLSTFEKDMVSVLKETDDVVTQASLLWRMIYYVVDQLKKRNPNFILLRHEDLSLDPVNEFEKVYTTLGLDYSSKVKQAIVAASSSENPTETSSKAVYSVQLDSRANLANWKSRVNSEEIERIRELTEPVASLYYQSDDWL
jgi:hypothetical protein